MGQADLVQDNLRVTGASTYRVQQWNDTCDLVNRHWDRVCNLACCRKSQSLAPQAERHENHLFHLSGSSLAQLFNETNPIYFSKSCKNPRHIVLEENETQQIFIAVPLLLRTRLKALLSLSHFTMEAGPTGWLGTQVQRRVRNCCPTSPAYLVPSLGAYVLNSFIHSLHSYCADIITGAHWCLQLSSLFLSPHSWI